MLSWIKYREKEMSVFANLLKNQAKQIIVEIDFVNNAIILLSNNKILWSNCDIVINHKSMARDDDYSLPFNTYGIRRVYPIKSLSFSDTKIIQVEKEKITLKQDGLHHITLLIQFI